MAQTIFVDTSRIPAQEKQNNSTHATTSQSSKLQLAWSSKTGNVRSQPRRAEQLGVVVVVMMVAGASFSSLVSSPSSSSSASEELSASSALGLSPPASVGVCSSAMLVSSAAPESAAGGGASLEGAGEAIVDDYYLR